MSLLRRLEGLTATKAMKVHDYVQLLFGDTARLSIFNITSIAPPSKDIDELAGHIITSVVEKEDSIEISFLGAAVLFIDLRPEAFRGPEALQLNFLGESPIVLT